MTTFANDKKTSMTTDCCDSSGSSDSLRKHSSVLKDDVKTLKDDAVAAAHTAKECLQNEAEQVAAIAKTGGEKAQQMHNMVCDNVKRHPTAAVLTTLGVGIMLGRVFSGR